ncbi:MAG TPA: hypothetical protein GX703_04060 [Erysipelothrix sp.]|jgi:hypothetical protein|nr:hypothetical protein [Erysipelothrix sp.]
MKTLKEEVTSVFNTIQYDSEVIMTSLDVLGHSSQAREFISIYSGYLLNRLRLTKETLLSTQNREELSEVLKLAEADYQILFETMNKQISRLKNSEDISDYLFQLKQESKDLSPCFVDKVKSLLSRKV